MTPHVRNSGPITHQSASFDLLASGIGRRNAVARRKRCKLDAPANEERVGRDKQGIGPIAHYVSGCRNNRAVGRRLHPSKMKELMALAARLPQTVYRRLNFRPLWLGRNRNVGIWSR